MSCTRSRAVVRFLTVMLQLAWGVMLLACTTPEPCTMLGCDDTLNVGLLGSGVPLDYTISARSAEGNTLIVRCQWNYEASVAESRTRQYSLDVSESINELVGASVAPDVCNSRVAYVVETLMHQFGDERESWVKQIVVQCFEPKSYSVMGSFCMPCCDSIHESCGVSLLGFAPEELTLGIYWDNGGKVETFRPSYSIQRPNGPRCAPECRIGSLFVEIP